MTNEELILLLQRAGVLDADWETDTICHLSPVNDCFLKCCTLYFDKEGNIVGYKG